MTTEEIKKIIRTCKFLPELAELVYDHDRLERENAELRAALETATATGVVEQVEET